MDFSKCLKKKKKEVGKKTSAPVLDGKAKLETQIILRRKSEVEAEPDIPHSPGKCRKERAQAKLTCTVQKGRKTKHTFSSS